MSNTLLPCPFCGGEAELYGVPHIPKGWDFIPRCKATSCCGRQAKKYSNRETAIAAWNRRANLGSCENELIVRCKNCKHYNRTGCSDGFGWCERMDIGTNDNFYCSLAERSEG